MHPGVQDMACDTFLKISQKCRRKFVILQVGEAMPFIDELCLNLRAIISDLEPGQVGASVSALVALRRSANAVAGGSESAASPPDPPALSPFGRCTSSTRRWRAWSRHRQTRRHVTRC